MGVVSNKIHQVRMYDDLAAEVHSMAVVEALASGWELVNEDGAQAVVDDGDSADGLGDGIAYDAGYPHAETTSYGAEVVQDHAPVPEEEEAHDRDQMSDFDCNLHDLDV